MQSLFEKSLSRVFNFYKNEDFGLLTSWKQNMNWVDNSQKFRELKAEIARRGFGHINLTGVGQEGTTTDGTMNAVREPSVLIPNRKYDSFKQPDLAKSEAIPFEEFRQIIVELGRLNEKNPQYAVIVHENNNQTTHLVDPVSGQDREAMKNIKFSDFEQFWSELYDVWNGMQKSPEQQAKLQAEYDKGKRTKPTKSVRFAFEYVEVGRIPMSIREALGCLRSGELFEIMDSEDEKLQMEDCKETLRFARKLFCL